MTLDLAHLRTVAEDCRNATRRLRQTSDAFDVDDAHDASEELARELTPSVVLELLDRLERAEKKLAERDAVYPTLMTQVGKEKKT